jgi:hypothetical protein
MALGVLKSIAEDTAAPKAIRVRAAESWLDRAGVVYERTTGKGEGGHKELSEMSVSELEATAKALRAQLDKAHETDKDLRAIDGEAVTAPSISRRDAFK